MAKSDTLDELVNDCVLRVRRLFGETPRLAVVLGSGFQDVLGQSDIIEAIDFEQLPGFPQLRVSGHPGRLSLARFGQLQVLVCGGRAHYYEGHEMEQVTFPVRVMAGLGVKEIMLTNAAGGINPGFRPGDFMVFSDHINFTGVNPLRGLPVLDNRCFVDLTDAYSNALNKELLAAARKTGVKVHRGVYLAVSGPSYETPAEIRAFRKLGADAVGMSTIPEVLMARYHGINVAAISCITNPAAGLSPRKLSHSEVLNRGRESAQAAGRWLEEFARRRFQAETLPKNTPSVPAPKRKRPRRNKLRIDPQELPSRAKVT